MSSNTIIYISNLCFLKNIELVNFLSNLDEGSDGGDDDDDVGM